MAKLSLPISQPLTEEEVESPFGLVGKFQPASQVFSLTFLLRITIAASSVVRKAGAPEVRAQYSQVSGIDTQLLGLH